MENVGQGASNVNPLAFAFLVAMSLGIFTSNRRNAVAALLITAALIPLGQDIIIGGLHFYFLRILILAGLGRLLMRHETAGLKLAMVDKLFVGWVLVGFVCGLIQKPSAETFGAVYDTAGVYFIIRVLTRDPEDVLLYLRVLAFLGIAVGVSMICEAVTHHDPFYVLGGVPSNPMERGDRLRCEGPFRQPIMAGTFGATLFPLMVGLWQQGRNNKWLAFWGMIGAVVITITSASSGPLFTLLAAITGFCLWPMRWRMRLFRRGMVAMIILLALVMKAPVWFLIGKISGLTGGGGYYRSYLIDQFIRHFTQWWLIGTSYTANWAIAGIVLPNNPDMVDITNHYIAQGIKGGLLGLGLFLAMIVVCFKIVGRSVRGEGEPAVNRLLLWAFGVCLAAHCAAFISVSYFDQIQVFWFWLLAVIATVPLWAVQKSDEDLMSQEVEDARVESGRGETVAGGNCLV